MVWNKLAGKYDNLWVQKYSLEPTRKAVIKIIQDLNLIDSHIVDIKNEAGQNLEYNNVPYDGGHKVPIIEGTIISNDKNTIFAEDKNKKESPKYRIIDIGCGTGQLLDDICKTGIPCELTGFDKSSEMILSAKAKNIDATLFCADIAEDFADAIKREIPDVKEIENLSAPTQIESKPSSPVMFQKPKSDNLNLSNSGESDYLKFDLAICCHSFPYYKNKPGIVSKIHNMIRENGHAIFVQASINNPYDGFVMSLIEKTAEKADYLSREEFTELMKNKFEIISTFKIHEKWFMPSICGFVMKKI